MSNWRDSKLFIAASSCIAGFLCSAAIAFTYVIPVFQKQDSNTIDELNIKIINLNKSQKEKIDSLTNTIDIKNKKIDDLQLSISKLTNGNNNYKNQLLLLSTLSTFQHGQPLPIGYSSILPGMKLSEVINKYNKETLDIDPKGNSITVKVEAGGIESIIYTAGVEEAPEIITSIIVTKYDLKTFIDGESIDEKNDEQSLLHLLQENLGQKEQCSSGEYTWSIDKYRYVYYNESTPYFYHIFFSSVYAPGTSSRCLKPIRALIGKDK